MISSGPSFGIARFGLVFLDVDRGVHIFLHEALGQQNRVLVIVAFPGHEADQRVAAERNFALIRRRAVRDRLARCDTTSPSETIGCWLMQVPWLERANF